MAAWLSQNLATVLVVLALAALVALVVRKLVRDRKNGKSACGCGCADCPMRNACAKNEQKVRLRKK